MALAKITILGFKSYLDATGDDLFKNLTIPADIDRETLINNIYNECADFECLYSDPYYMQFMIQTWSKKHLRTWQKWVDALNIEYDPLYNYDRREEWDDVGTKQVVGQNSNKHNESNSSSYENETSASATTEDEAATTNQVSAYDSSAFQNDTKSSSEGSVTNESSGSNSGSNSASGQASDIGSNSLDESNTNKRTGRAYGNIGVTTSQQMLESELEIARFNIINQITDMFVDEFCIPVYV